MNLFIEYFQISLIFYPILYELQSPYTYVGYGGRVGTLIKKCLFSAVNADPCDYVGVAVVVAVVA